MEYGLRRHQDVPIDNPALIEAGAGGGGEFGRSWPRWSLVTTWWLMVEDDGGDSVGQVAMQSSLIS